MEHEELVLELKELAVRFSEGWHEGIKIDALDIMLLNEAAEALAQPAQEPVDMEVMAASQRKPLTQDGTMEIANQTAGQYWMDEAHIQRFRAAVEAAHGIGE